MRAVTDVWESILRKYGVREASASTVDDGFLQTVETLIGLGFPQSYRAILKYRHHARVDAAPYVFPEFPVGMTPERFVERRYMDGGPSASALENQLIPVAEYEDWGILAFDTSTAGPDGEPTVVLLDHDSGSWRQVFADLAEMLQAAELGRGAAPSAQSTRDDLIVVVGVGLVRRAAKGPNDDAWLAIDGPGESNPFKLGAREWRTPLSPALALEVLREAGSARPPPTTARWERIGGRHVAELRETLAEGSHGFGPDAVLLAQHISVVRGWSERPGWDDPEAREIASHAIRRIAVECSHVLGRPVQELLTELSL